MLTEMQKYEMRNELRDIRAKHPSVTEELARETFLMFVGDQLDDDEREEAFKIISEEYQTGNIIGEEKK